LPHSPQNLNCGGFSNPHAAHRFFIGAAQLPQNFIPAGFSVPQLEHRIVDDSIAASEFGLAQNRRDHHL